MKSLPERQGEVGRQLVFPEGFSTGLNLHRSDAPSGAIRRSGVQDAGDKRAESPGK